MNPIFGLIFLIFFIACFALIIIFHVNSDNDFDKYELQKAEELLAWKDERLKSEIENLHNEYEKGDSRCQKI